MRFRTVLLLSSLALTVGGLASAHAAPGFPGAKPKLPGGKKAFKPTKPVVQPTALKDKRLIPPVQDNYPLTITEDPKGPKAWTAGGYAYLHGSFGSTRYPVAIYNADGIELTAVARSWSPTKIKFQIPAKTEPGYYFVQLMDFKRVKKSNFVQIVVHPKLPSCDNPDRDGDKYKAVHCGGLDCNDNDKTISPDATEVCDANGVDEDCDATTFGTRDLDHDGHVDWMCCNGDNCGSDCDDQVASTHYGSNETCNYVDDNCDGDVDEGVQLTMFRDADRDLYGDPNRTTLTCSVGDKTGWVTNSLDCDDNDRNKKPGFGCP